jgi:hypothetical protein
VDAQRILLARRIDLFELVGHGAHATLDRPDDGVEARRQCRREIIRITRRAGFEAFGSRLVRQVQRRRVDGHRDGQHPEQQASAESCGIPWRPAR